MMHRCPHCGQDCMSTLRKLFISPASQVSCRRCGGAVGLRWSHYLLVILPAALLLALIGRLGVEGFSLYAAVAALALAVVIAQLLLPLAGKRD